MREIFGRLRPQANSGTTHAIEPAHTTRYAHDVELENNTPSDITKNTSVTSQPRMGSNQDTDSDKDPVQQNAQAGVQKMEATTQVWTKKHLAAAYVM